jgi:hypothetical protein
MKTGLLLLLMPIMAGCGISDRSHSTAEPRVTSRPVVLTRVKLSAAAPEAKIPWRSVKTIVRIRNERNPMDPIKLEVAGEGGLILTRGGSAPWHLGPGEYTVYSVSFSELSIGGNALQDVSYRIYAPFRIPPAAAGVYTGDLELTLLPGDGKGTQAFPAQRANQAGGLSAPQNAGVGLLTEVVYLVAETTAKAAVNAVQPAAEISLNVTAQVVDHMDAAVEEFTKKLPKSANISFNKSLMKLEPAR